MPSEAKLRLVSCPHCGKTTPGSTANLFRPFCSERCKMIDLGAWASEEYRVAVKGKDEDPDERSAGLEPDPP